MAPRAVPLVDGMARYLQYGVAQRGNRRVK
jgi:hypothetical protein